MGNFNDPEYVFDYEYLENCRVVQSAKLNTKVDVIVCLIVHRHVPLNKRNVPSFKAKGTLKEDGFFLMEFQNDFGKQQFKQEYSVMLDEIARRQSIGAI